MKLFKVERSEKTKFDYDQYDSFICWANSVEEARFMSPCGGEFRKWHDNAWWFQYHDGERIEKENYNWPDHPDTLVVKELIPPKEPEVILASYNAG